MSSGTVLDSIIEGVRADVAVREAALSLADVKDLATRAPSPRMCWPRCVSRESASSPR